MLLRPSIAGYVSKIDVLEWKLKILDMDHY
jgi:hypothetical protein